MGTPRDGGGDLGLGSGNVDSHSETRPLDVLATGSIWPAGAHPCLPPPTLVSKIKCPRGSRFPEDKYSLSVALARPRSALLSPVDFAILGESRFPISGATQAFLRHSSSVWLLPGGIMQLLFNSDPFNSTPFNSLPLTYTLLSQSSCAVWKEIKQKI